MDFYFHLYYMDCFAIKCICVIKSESESHSVVSDSLRSHGLYSPWNSPGQYTAVGRLSFLQRIFPTQGSNPCLLSLLHWVLYHFTTWGSPNDYSTKRLQLYQKGNQLCWLAELKLQCWEILKHTVSYSEIFSMTFVFMLPLYRAPSTWK